MILDNSKINNIKSSQIQPFLDALEKQNDIIMQLMSEQKEQNAQLGKLTMMVLETMKMIQKEDSDEMYEDLQAQMMTGINQLSITSSKTLKTLAEVTEIMSKNTMNAESLREFADRVTGKDAKSQWSFNIKRDSNGMMTSVVAKKG